MPRGSGGIPAQTHGGRTNGLTAGTGNCCAGSAVPGQQLRGGNPGCSLCHGPEQELGRPEEQFGSETTAGSFRSEVGIGSSKVPGCLLRAIKNLRKKRRWEGSPSPDPSGAAGWDSHQPGPAPFSSSPGPRLQLGCPGPPDTPRPQGSAGAAARTPSMDLCSLPGTKPSCNTWPGLQENGKSRGEALLDQCCLEKGFPRARGEGRDPVPQAGAGNTPQTHPGPQTFPVSMQHNPVTKTGFSGENMDINMDLNVGSPSGSTAQCPGQNSCSAPIRNAQVSLRVRTPHLECSDRKHIPGGGKSTESSTRSPRGCPGS